MKNLILSSVLVLIASSAAQAQEAVQWRIEEGGNGHWYKIDTARTWLDARDFAVARGGHLVTLSSQQEWNFVRAQLPLSGQPYWLGMYQDPPTGLPPAAGWRWVTSEPFSFTAWAPGEPNDWQGYQQWVGQTTASGQWDDTTPNGVMSPVFEWDADCNNDGIVDYGQCRDGTLPDYNGNNVPDCCESGTPCVVGNYPVQWRVAEGGNGHWYKIRPKVGDWHACRSAALAAGADLASPSTSAENLFVERFVPSPSGSSLNRVFIGGRQAPGSSPTVGWYWIDGSDWDYTDWQFNQPNGNEGYLAVFVYGATVVWGDYVADSIDLCCFLVEWSADCNNDGVVDHGQILQGQLVDADANGVPDVCEVDPCPGDITNGGTVDATDLSIVLAAWGTTGQGEFQADIDGSGLVDGGDLALVLGGWGPCPQ